MVENTEARAESKGRTWETEHKAQAGRQPSTAKRPTSKQRWDPAFGGQSSEGQYVPGGVTEDLVMVGVNAAGSAPRARAKWQ